MATVTTNSCPCATWATSPEAFNTWGRGSGHHPNCDGTGHHKNEWKPPSLQLLVIDMGDTTVVKVEKGSIGHPSVSGTAFSMLTDGLKVGENLNKPRIIHKPFADLQAALDDAPVPRIEKRDNRESPWLYQLFEQSGAKDNYLTSAEYNALSQLAGHPLPIWSGGTWERIETNEIFVWRYQR